MDNILGPLAFDLLEKAAGLATILGLIFAAYSLRGQQKKAQIERNKAMDLEWQNSKKRIEINTKKLAESLEFYMRLEELYLCTISTLNAQSIRANKARFRSEAQAPENAILTPSKVHDLLRNTQYHLDENKTPKWY